MHFLWSRELNRISRSTPNQNFSFLRQIFLYFNQWSSENRWSLDNFSLVVFINFNFSVFLRLGWVFWNFGGASANTKINAAKPQAPPRQRGRAQPISDAHFREWVTVTRPQEQRYYEQQKSRWTWNAAKTRATTPTHYYEKTQFLTWML